VIADLAGVVFNGLFSAMVVFIFAAGLTLLFGVLRILNFSQGGFFAIGAYLSFSMTRLIAPEISLATFLAVAIAAGIIVGLLGIVTEWVVLRRLRQVDGAYSLIATYALLLITEGAVKLIWGVNVRSLEPPAELAGVVMLGDVFMPNYALFIILTGFALFVVLEWLLHHSTLGKLMQSVATDPWMANVLGVNVARMQTWIVVGGFFLAGTAGGLLVPNQALSPGLAGTFVIQAFGALIVGGMGSVRGTFFAAILLCVVDSLASVYLPGLPGIFFYVAMAAMLLLRPQGLVRGAQL
jgi:branched-chain amino acid transport system permease protein